MLETIFGPTLTLSTDRVIPTRWVGEQHVTEDLGRIPSFADWARAIRPEPWMGRAQPIHQQLDPFAAAQPPTQGRRAMSEYIVKMGFWLRAYDGFSVEANSDVEAIEKAKAAAAIAMQSTAHPEHVEIAERREGVIAFIGRVIPQRPQTRH